MKRFVEFDDCDFGMVEQDSLFELADMARDGLATAMELPLTTVGNVSMSTGHEKIESTLMMVGLRRVGATGRPEFHKHRQRFDVFSRGDFFFEKQAVVRFELPVIGAGILDSGMLTNVVVNAETGKLVFGQHKDASVIGGVRRRLPGEEVVQFVVHTSTRRVVILYSCDRISILSTGGPAVYRKYQNKYYLINGEPTLDFPWHSNDYAQPTSEVLQFDDESDDDDDNGDNPFNMSMDCIDYDVFPDRIVNLDSEDVVSASVVADLVPEGVSSYEILSPTTVRHVGVELVNRPYVFARNIVKHYVRPLCKDVRRYLPQVALKQVEMSYKFAGTDDPIEYVHCVSGSGLYARYSWNVRGIDITNTKSMYTQMRDDGHACVTPLLMMKYNNDNNAFILNGARLMSRVMFPRTLMSSANISFSNYPLLNDRQVILVVEHGLYPRVDSLFDASIRKGKSGNPYYILYCSDDYVVSGIGLIIPKMLHPLSGNHIRRLISLLSPNYAIVSSQLAASVDMKEREMCHMMGGRPDLFCHQLRRGKMYWALSYTTCGSDRVVKIYDLNVVPDDVRSRCNITRILN